MINVSRCVYILGKTTRFAFGHQGTTVFFPFSISISISICMCMCVLQVCVNVCSKIITILKRNPIIWTRTFPVDRCITHTSTLTFLFKIKVLTFRFNYFLLNDLICSRWQLISFRSDAQYICLDSHSPRRVVALVLHVSTSIVNVICRIATIVKTNQQYRIKQSQSNCTTPACNPSWPWP